MFDWTLVNGIRRVARRLGLIWLFSMPARSRERKLAKVYQTTRPTEVVVSYSKWKRRMRVAALGEYRRVLSFEDDRHLLSALESVIRPGDVVWDVGANIGVYTTLFSGMVGQDGAVYAFEPDEFARARLMENIRLNELVNVNVMAEALGDKDSEMMMFAATEYFTGVSSLVQRDSQPEGAVASMVHVLRADTCVGEGRCSAPNVMKIDVEGFESEVVRGAELALRSGVCRAVLCEVHFSILEDRGAAEGAKELVEAFRRAGLVRHRWIDRSHLLVIRD